MEERRIDQRIDIDEAGELHFYRRRLDPRPKALRIRNWSAGGVSVNSKVRLVEGCDVRIYCEALGGEPLTARVVTTAWTPAGFISGLCFTAEGTECEPMSDAVEDPIVVRTLPEGGHHEERFTGEPVAVAAKRRPRATTNYSFFSLPE